MFKYKKVDTFLNSFDWIAFGPKRIVIFIYKFYETIAIINVTYE